VSALQRTPEAARVPFVTGRRWTTEAFYRETRARDQRQVAEGCITGNRGEPVTPYNCPTIGDPWIP
jgi:hypothetical protein